MSILLDTTKIIDDVNAKLAAHQRIEPDDPIITSVILNQVILAQCLGEICQTLETQKNQFIQAISAEEKAASKTASSIITQASEYFCQQLYDTLGTAQKQMLTSVQQTPWTTVQPKPVYRSIGFWLTLLTGILLGIMLGSVFSKTAAWSLPHLLMSGGHIG